MTDLFIKLEYGKYFQLDLHGKSIQDSYAELIYTLNVLDLSYKSILVVHGYHAGTVLKDYIREKFTHDLVINKVNIDAGRTLLILKTIKAVSAHHKQRCAFRQPFCSCANGLRNNA